MSLLLYRLGLRAARHPWTVIGAWLLLLLVLVTVVARWGGETSESLAIPGTESQQAFDLLEDRFPERTGEEARIVFAAPPGQTLTEPGPAAAVAAVAGEVRTHPGVQAVTSFTGGEGGGQLSADRRIGFIAVRYAGDHDDVGPAGVERLEQATEHARAAGLEVALGGDIVEFNQETLDGSSEVIGLGVAIIVLLVAFGSVVAMGLPIVTAMFALGAGLLLVTIVGRVTDIPDFGPAMATMIGLGVGIDYALFLVTRHRENLDAGLPVHESVARATATAGQAVVFAGATVVIAILGLQAVGIPFVTGLGHASAVVVAVSVLAAITLLPALLGAVGAGVNRLRLPTRRPAEPARTLAGRWAGRVARRPWPYLVASLAVLATLTVPFFSIRLGQYDAGTLPPSSTVRQAYDLLARGFGPGFNGPFVVAIDLARADAGAADRVADAVRDDPGIVFVSQPVVNAPGDAAVVTAIPATSPQDPDTEATIARLRSTVLDRAAGEAGAAAYLTGSTASFVDISQKIEDRLPLFVGSVLALSFLLLMVVFRSLLVPLKAALVNLLGIGASYGVIVAVFQWGWMKDVVGIEETVPIVSFLPLFMFAILFGLSMDYEVFLMSRIREEYLHHGDNIASVESGIASTARVITAAAVIMISVFGSFALMDDVAVKMSGIGLATAIFLDATLIRMVLVPATMAVAGRANWWFPAWLDRVLPRLDIDGETTLPERPPVGSQAAAGADRDRHPAPVSTRGAHRALERRSP